MKLTAFKIENFKSIIDTGWCNLSPDNITGLIGQNESGKTSILEALFCFYSGKLSEEYLRSDESLPIVSCSFHIEDKEFDKLFGTLNLPPTIATLVKEKKRINLTRIWKNKNESEISLEEQSFKDNFIDLNNLIEANADGSQTAIINEKGFALLVFNSIPRFEIFEDFGSLLPNTIDIADIASKNTIVEGYQGVMNFLKLVEIDLDHLTSDNIRMLSNKLDSLNKKITKQFKKFWKQKIGKTNKISIEFEIKNYSNTAEGKTAGTPYLVFWINDGQEKLYPKQRSKGVRWFLSFYLQIMASSLRDEEKGRLFLIDEPGGNLHATAQRDVLEILDSTKDKIQVIYATHAPHLISLEHIYRLLAIQRDDEADDSSPTRVLTSHELGAASRDTLSPLYTLIGACFNDQQVIKKSNNIIVEEISAFYYISAFWKLAKATKKVSFLPATGVTNIPLLANLFLGWGIDFIVVVDDEPNGRKVYNELKESLCGNDEERTKKKLLKIKGCTGIEDLFSQNDFKKYILKNEGESIGVSNTEYLNTSKSAKGILALEFYLKVKDDSIDIVNLEQQTQDNINELIKSIVGMLSTGSSTG